jgi:glutathione S-transferase
MSDLILHHYPNSPFSEKVRLILGAKGLAWRSVHIPVVMPKPDVVALTGGYRKTPFMQVGADIYCDSALIARLLDARQPAPALYPASAPLARPLAQWADFQLFWCAVAWTMQPAGAAAMLGPNVATLGKAFAVDRAAMTSSMKRMTLADATVQLKAHLAALDAQLAAGGPFLFGDAVSIADFSVAHCVWFIRLGGPVAAILEPYRAIGAWLERMLAFGHATHDELSSTDAIAIAAASASSPGSRSTSMPPTTAATPRPAPWWA